MDIWKDILNIIEYMFHLAIGTHFITVIGFIAGLIVMSQLLRERRQSSNIFAWFLLILFLPFIGLILYFLFGGRKSKYVLKNKRRVREFAAEIAKDPHPDTIPSNNRFYHFYELNGNSFELLPDGVTAFEALCKEIKEAKESIHIMTYILGRDEGAREIVELLAKRAEEGLDVKLLLDAIGSLGKTGRFVDPIRKAGGRAARFMPVIPLQTRTSANLRNHRKIALFDKKRVLIGGQNIEKRFMGPKPDPKRFIDFSAIIEGPIVSQFNRHFISDWCFATKDNVQDFRDILLYRPDKAGDNNMQMIPSGPDFVRDTIWEQLVVCIQECQEELLVVSPYFIPDEVIMASLAVKAHAGKRIRLIIPEKSNQRLVDFARYHYLRELHQKGIEIYFYHPGMVHAKLFIVDHKIAMIGSANMDQRSFFLNFEIGLFIKSSEPIQQLEEWANRLILKSTPFHASAKAEAKPSRMLLEDIAQLIVPLL